MALYETLKYRTLIKNGNIEIREYDDFMLASTKTQRDRTNSSGFSNVFNYISGNNRSKEKISMTTPVVTYEEEDKLITGFYVPSKYNKENVPKPASNNVFIKEMEKSIYAVIKFKGAWTESNFEKQEEELVRYINNNGYKIISERYLLRYQPPFVPGIFRKNEIAFKVEKV